MEAYEQRVNALADLLRDKRRELEGLAWHTLSLRGLRPGPADVEDALSEAYLRAATRFRNDPTLEVENLQAWFRAFIFVVCLKQADRRYKLGLGATIEEMEFEVMVLETSTFNRILANELLDRLDPREQQILRRFAEGFTSAEIAVELEMSPEQVRQIKSRAIQRLKRGKDESHE